MEKHHEPWWKDAIVYQVWPASFKDLNGDGIGDIQGVISALDYLKELGVDVVWLSPMYKSPQVDMGYDVSDYEVVHEPYGTMADMQQLIDQLHARGMRLILDLVINHTSDQHAWFQESRSSKDNPKRNWYVWRPASYDEAGNRQPPNNWRAVFGGSVWEWDEQTEEYYLHYFAREQPDLNWDNEETRNAIYGSAIRFWLDKGVDGFRVDTVNKYSKPTQFLDAPSTDTGSQWQYAYNLFCNGPRMHEFLKEMNEKALAPYGEIMTVGELPCTPDTREILRYVSAKEKELDMVFHFDMVHLGMGTVRKYIPEPFKLTDVKTSLSKWQEFIVGTDAWTTVFGENHDTGRSISRFASDAPQHREASAKLLALLFTTLTGTLFIYQGQEIGMVNVPRDWPIQEYKDLESQNFYARMEKEANGDAGSLEKAMDGIALLARDHARTPMQWDGSSAAGFTSGTPWMRVHDNYRDVNVQKALGDPQSSLSFWKKMLQIRKKNSRVFTRGVFKEYDHDNQAVFTYLKQADMDGELGACSALVVLNFSNEDQKFSLPEDLKESNVKLGLSTLDPDQTGNAHILAPYEGRLFWVS